MTGATQPPSPLRPDAVSSQYPERDTMSARLGLPRRIVLCSIAGVMAASTAVVAAPGPYQRPGKTVLVSVNSAGQQASDTSNWPWISADGSCVAFTSASRNLAPGVEAVTGGVFLRNLRTGRTTLVSVAADGGPLIIPPDQTGSADPMVSADCRYVAFGSGAINLVPGDTNLVRDVFVRDMVSRTTERVSVSTTGAQADKHVSWPSISANGRYVTFFSAASNLVPNDTNGEEDVFVRDRTTGRTELVSVSKTGGVSNGESYVPSISADGRHVAFVSWSTDLVADRVEGIRNVFVRDLRARRTTQVSVATDGSQPSFAHLPACQVSTRQVDLPKAVTDITGEVEFTTGLACSSSIGRQAISDDGRFVVFGSYASNLVPNDTNFDPVTSGNPVSTGYDYFVRDLRLNRTERVSVDSRGHQRSDTRQGGSPAISGDGRIVAFLSTRQAAACWLPLQLIACGDATRVFAYDRLSGADEHVTVSMSGGDPQPGRCGPALPGVDTARLIAHQPTLSRSGDRIAFMSSASNLVKGERDGTCDVYVRMRGHALGTGALEGTPPPSSGAPEPCLIPDVLCLPPGADPATGSLLGARVVPRPSTSDLLVRWDVSRLAANGGATTPILFGLRFIAHGQAYEIRAQRVPDADFDAAGGASFGLFRESLPGAFTKVATLKGGYGTVGESVVTAVPLAQIGLSDGGLLSDVTAFTAMGGYTTGVARIIDAVQLSR